MLCPLQQVRLHIEDTMLQGRQAGNCRSALLNLYERHFVPEYLHPIYLNVPWDEKNQLCGGSASHRHPLREMEAW